MYFDGSLTVFRKGAEIVLIPLNAEVNYLMKNLELISSYLNRNNISLEEELKRKWCSLILGSELNSLKSIRETISLVFKLIFSCTNNQVEHEALIFGLFTANGIGINNLCIHGDSNLIIKQTNDLWTSMMMLLLS